MRVRDTIDSFLHIAQVEDREVNFIYCTPKNYEILRNELGIESGFLIVYKGIPVLNREFEESIAIMYR